jgi:hypothetical protein
VVDATKSTSKSSLHDVSSISAFTDVGILLLRLMVGIVFITSEWDDLKDPEAQSKDIEMSKGSTRCGGFDIDNARRDSEKDFRLAHRLLG